MAERSLRDLGMRGDIIKTMHRAFTERGEARGVADYAIESGQPTSEIIGRLVDRGLHDELTGEAYALIDGTDGRAHHVRFRGIEAFEHAPPIGGIVEVRRFGQAGDAHPRPAEGIARLAGAGLDGAGSRQPALSGSEGRRGDRALLSAGWAHLLRLQGAGLTVRRRRRRPHPVGEGRRAASVSSRRLPQCMAARPVKTTRITVTNAPET
jgi:hypothetical protein